MFYHFLKQVKIIKRLSHVHEVQFMQELYQNGKMEVLIINSGEKDQQKGIKVDICIDKIYYQSALVTDFVPFETQDSTFEM